MPPSYLREHSWPLVTLIVLTLLLTALASSVVWRLLALDRKLPRDQPEDWAERLTTGALRSRPVQLVFLAAAILTTLVQFFLRYPAHIDIGNLVAIVQRMLSGQRLYRDIVEPAPPMFFLLATPSGAIAKLTGVPPLAAYSAQVLLLLLVVGTLIARVWHDSRLPWDPRLGLMLIWALLYVFATYPGDGVGQKEYTAELFLLPYVVSAAALADGRPLSRRLGLLSGALVGVSICIKPYFAVVWLLIEAALLLLWRQRSAWRRPETQGMVLAGLANLIFLVLLFPDYGANIQLAAQAYGAFIQLPLSTVLQDGNIPLLGVALLAAFIPLQSRLRTLRSMLGMAMAGFIVSALVQRKGWQYHWNAAEGLGILTLTVAGLDAALESGRLRAPWRPLLELLPLAGVLTFSSLAVAQSAIILRGQPSPAAARVESVTDFLRTHARGQKVAWIAMDLFPAQPSMTYAETTSVLRLGNLWPIPSLYPEEWGRVGRFDYHSTKQMTVLERRIIDSEIEDLQRNAPTVIVVEGLPHLTFAFPFRFNTFEYFMRDARFREVLEHYRLVRNEGGYRYFVRVPE